MKSFGIKRDEKDPRWEKFIEWLNEKFNSNIIGSANHKFYGINTRGQLDLFSDSSRFDRIITLEEWESEFMTKLAGREYDERLIRQWHLNCCLPIEQFLNQRYAKQDRIAEIKAEIEKLSNELKELENGGV